tara:strand:+ start:501 stop:980 length:480 start_codon:yes stop_codon:yes gene_type:complete
MRSNAYLLLSLFLLISAQLTADEPLEVRYFRSLASEVNAANLTWKKGATLMQTPITDDPWFRQFRLIVSKAKFETKGSKCICSPIPNADFFADDEEAFTLLLDYVEGVRIAPVSKFGGLHIVGAEAKELVEHILSRHPFETSEGASNQSPETTPASAPH